jgi:hypothetical protein
MFGIMPYPMAKSSKKKQMFDLFSHSGLACAMPRIIAEKDMMSSEKIA